jgi:hypothetical protein
MATYYVDTLNTSANNANAGTEGSPWKTLQYAADRVQAGDTVLIKGGNYAPFKVNVSGTEGAEITFAAAPGHEQNVVIDGSGLSARGLIEIRGQSYVTVSGFRLQDAPTDGIYVEGAPDGERGIKLLGNSIDGTQNAGIYAAGLVMGQTIPVNEYRLFDLEIAGNEVTRTNIGDGGNEAISIGGGVDGFKIHNNWVHDSEQYGIDAKLGARNGEIYENLVHGIERHGIYLDSGSRTIENVKIYGNWIFDNNNGICLARESARDPKEPNIRNIEIFDNAVFDNNQYGIMAYKHIRDVLTGDFDDVSIHDNAIAGNGRDGVHLLGIGSIADNFTVWSNDFYQNARDIRNEIGAEVFDNIFGVMPDLSVPDPQDVMAGGMEPPPPPPNALPEVEMPAAISVAENQTDVLTATATDADGDPITFSLAGGQDFDHFVIDSVSGELSFIDPPDFENPTDMDGDGKYRVWVEASDGEASDSELVEVTVTDVDETPPPPADHFIFSLVDASRDVVIDTNVKDGITGLDSAEMKGLLTFVATPVDPITGPVVMKIVGPGINYTLSEANAPYALFGNDGANYKGRVLAEGDYTVSATNNGLTESVIVTLDDLI